MPSALLTTTSKAPPALAFSDKVTVIAPPFSAPLTSAMVTTGATESSLLMVTVPVSLKSTARLVAARFERLTPTVSLVSTVPSKVGVTVKLWVSKAVPAKVRVWPLTAV